MCSSDCLCQSVQLKNTLRFLCVNSVLKYDDDAMCLKKNYREDMYAQDSIELLTTSGLQFKKHEEEGIETLYFAELLMTSGVVLCEGVKWLSFHR